MENLEEKYQEALQAIAYLHNELENVKRCQCDESEESEEDNEA
jgi:FtsZ-binding cell division protein ZapB